MKLTNAIQQQDRFHLKKLLILFWLLMQCLLIYQFGIVTNLEAEAYISVANSYISTGHYPSGNFLFYSVQIWLDIFCIKFNTGFVPVLLIQLLLNGLSSIYFHKLILKFTASERVAFGFTLALTGMYYYQLYNVHLYTESIFFSLGILYTYYLFSISRFSAKAIILVTLGILLLCLTRPTGIFFFPASFLYLLLKFFKRRAKLVILVSFITGGLLFFFLLNFALSSGGGLDFLLPYVQQQIICGIPNEVERNDIIVNGNQNSVQGIWYIISHYPRLFFSLGTKRFMAFWGIYRSYYSTAHNIFACTYFFSIYVLVLFAIKKIYKRFAAAGIYILTLVTLLTITVVLSCDEWHNRFIFSILPFLLLAASCSFRKQEPDVV